MRGKGLRRGVIVEIERLGDLETSSISQSPNLSISAQITAVHESGIRTVRFAEPINSYLGELGEIPLPPYITAYTGDRERYQTVYSRPEGSAAAPTAGLHFTPELLVQLRQQGVGFETTTLHVGLDTFKPVTVENIEEHPIHTEWAKLTAATARRINETTLQGGRIIAVGTTTARTLEWAATAAQGLNPYDSQACPWQRVAAFAGNVSLFIRPGYRFRAVDALITNFHLPRSSLLLMVSAFVGQAQADDVDAGRRMLLAAYEEAKRMEYRFFSFGDAMLIL
jgi:S-adenosylmethionine:tRNA ribosyltransferase-isomerase